ncbi:hypothetical protein ACL07V_02680 [Streptomyces sp. MB22_4]
MDLFQSPDHQAGESLTLGYLDVQHLPSVKPRKTLRTPAPTEATHP